MASAAAQKLFNMFSPDEQAQIRASWGGQDMMDQWYENAKAAGAVPEESSQGSYSANNPTPAQLRQKAAAEGWSEDFERFDDRQLQMWINNYWDPARGRFRSQHAPEGAGDWAYVEKPTESVIDPSSGTEYGPQGNRSGVANPNAGGGGGGSAAGGAGGATSGMNAYESDLQRALTDLYSKRGGMFGGANAPGTSLEGGGLVWTDPSAIKAPTVPTPGGGGGGRGGAGGGGGLGSGIEWQTGVGTKESMGGGWTGTGSGNMALISGALNAFTPNAPSARIQTGEAPDVQGGRPYSGQYDLGGGPTQYVPPATQPTQPATTPAQPRENPILGPLNRHYNWWQTR